MNSDWELYILPWREQKPSAGDVHLAMGQGGLVVSDVKVYDNGTLNLWCQTDPAKVWEENWPLKQSPSAEDRLSVHIHNLLVAQQDLQAISEHKRSTSEKAILAAIALLLYGYGVGDA